MSARRNPFARPASRSSSAANARRRSPARRAEAPKGLLLIRPLRFAIALSLCGFALAGVALRSRAR